MLTTLLLTAALVTPSPEPPFQPNRRQLIQSASGMAKYKPVIGPMIAMAMLPDVVTSAGPRTIASFGGGGSLGGDLYLLDLVDFKLASTSTIQWSATTDPTAAKDVGFSRPSVGLIKVTNGGTGLGTFQLGKLTLTSLATPATPVITQGGTPAGTAYSYKIVAKLPDTTTTEAGTAGSTATGPAALGAVDYNIVTWAATTNAHCYDVWRTAGGATQGKIATCTTSPLNDTGLAGVGAGTEPVTNFTGAVNSANAGIVLGYGATGVGGANVVLGYLAQSAGSQGVAIGATAMATGNYSVAVGRVTTASAGNSTAVGTSTTTAGVSGISIGSTITNDGANSYAIGNNITIPATSNLALAVGSGANIGANSPTSIAIGPVATVPATRPNIMVVGGDAYQISDVYFSEGVTNATPLAYTINGTGGSGADIVGGDLQLAPGISTGAAVPGKVKIRNSRVIGTGSTPQTLADLAYFGDVAADGSTNFFNVTGTLPGTGLGGYPRAVLINITGAGSDATYGPQAFRSVLNAGYTGLNSSAAGSFLNTSVGTGVVDGGGGQAATHGIAASTTGAGTGDRIGLTAYHYGATTGKGIGVSGWAGSSTTAVGVIGYADSAVTNHFGGVFSLGSTHPTMTGTAALMADNMAVAEKIFDGRDNATSKWTIEDNGAVWAKTCEKALVSATPTEFVRVAMPASGRQGGVLEYCVDANDATNYQTRCGIIPFTFINEAGTEACTVGTTSDSDGTPTGTLSAAITTATASANTCDLLANADSSLAETTLRINAHIRLLGNAATAVTCP